VDVKDQPAARSVLQAMAEAYPDRVDLGLLAVVLGCERAAVDAAVCELMAAGLAQDEAAADSPQGHAACITEGGMALASGQAQAGESAAEVVQRLEVNTLLQLASVREAALKQGSATGPSASWPALRGRPA
jgi:hypothetical protein